MNQYNNYSRFRPASGFGNSRNVCPQRFGPNYGPMQRHNGPPFYPRNGPTRWADAYPMWQNQNINDQTAFQASTQHSPTSCVATVPRPKGPRTPPDPPPVDQPSIDSYLSPSKERHFDSTCDYKDYRSTDKHWEQNYRSQHRPQQRQHYRNQDRNMRGRRSSHPLPKPHHQMTSYQNNSDSSMLNTETPPPSALNTAVQSYLLQVLTTQPPPNVLQSPYNPIPTPSAFQSLLPHPTQTYPPLPPTPKRSATPPPPPSDEENWDTPSEASNDATAFQLNSPNQATAANIEFNVTDTLASGSLCDFGISDINASPSTNTNDNENHAATSDAIPNNTVQSDVYADRGLDASTSNNDYTSFKIKLPPRKDRLPQELENVEGNLLKGQLNKSHGNIGDPSLTIDIPIPDVITTSNANQQNDSLDKLDTILKIVTPQNTNPNGGNTSADTIDIPFRITLPHKEDTQSQERESVKGVAEQTLSKTKSKRKKNSTKSTTKVWPLELAEKALSVEQELLKEVSKENVLLLRFPDPPLSREMVKEFCKDIESVHFQQNSAPRFCFVHLKADVNVEKSIEIISKIPFGTGMIKAELRNASNVKSCSAAKADNIDPYTLYVGNLSSTLPCKVLKEHFPGASRINIGFAQRMKYTRYAFIQYQKVDDAIAAYRRMIKSEIEGRSLIIRFKRLGNANEPEENHGGGGGGGDLHDNEEHVETCSTISTSTIPLDNSEDIALATAESEHNECDISEETNGEFNRSEDYCDEPNVQELDVDCEINQSNNKQLTSKKLSNEMVVLKDNSNFAENINEIDENICNSKELVNSNVSTNDSSTNSNHDELSALEHTVEDPKECVTHTSATQTESEANAVEQLENAIIESTKNSDSNVVQTLTLEGEQDFENVTSNCRSTSTLKSEESPSGGIEDNERVVYSMPRTGKCIQNLNSDALNIVNKCELNEDFEFFSDRTSRTSVDIDTERPASTNSTYSSIELANACFSEQYLETRETSIAIPSHNRKAIESKEEISQELNETISRDMELLRQALNMKSTRTKTDSRINHEDLLIGNCKQPLTEQQQQRTKIDNTSNHEDLVPSKSLLLRRDSRLVSNDVAITGTYPTDSQQQVKNEFFEWGNQKTDVSNNKDKLQFIPDTGKDITQITTTRNNDSRKRKSPSSEGDTKPVVANADAEADDDLVPANCALNLYHKSMTIFDLTLDDDPIIQIKREAETEDLFSLPKRTANGKRSPMGESNDITCNGSTGSSFKHLQNNEQINDLTAINAVEQPYCVDDDDVVIVSGNLSTPPSHQDLPATQCLDYGNEKDAFRIKHESNSPTTIEKSFFGKLQRPTQHRDNLDRLFALLNSNSDDEL